MKDDNFHSEVKTGENISDEVRPVGKNAHRGLSATAIKMIAVICMFTDHFTAAVLQRMVSLHVWHTGIAISILGNKLSLEAFICDVLRGIGRISFPLYCFFIVEGFFHTRSRWKYALRLLIFAIVSEVPFDFALMGSWFYKEYQNVYFTLLIGLLVLWGIDWFRKNTVGGFVAVCFRILACLVPTSYMAYEFSSLFGIEENDTYGDYIFRGIWLALALLVCVFLFIYAAKAGKERARAVASTLAIIGVGAFTADFLETDYGGIGVLVIFIMYLLYYKKKNTGPAWAIGILAFTNTFEIPAILDIPILAFYNGKRGKGFKYFFYAFYPVHLTVIGIVCRCLRLI